MPICNYHEIELHLGRRKIIVGGFRKPEDSNECKDLKEKHGVEAVINLRGEGSNFDEKFAKKFYVGGFDLTFYTDDETVQVYDWYDDFINLPKPNNPLLYDAIYHTVMNAQDAGKKIALFCGTGDGRTGTALACLKLRELLEKEEAENKENFNVEPARTLKIFVNAMLPGKKIGGDVDVTPLVKQAIDSVRAADNPGHHALELANDVESVLLYEEHLRKLFSQRLKSGDNSYPLTPPVESVAIKKLENINNAYDFWLLINRFPPSQYQELIENAGIGVFGNPLLELGNEIASYGVTPDQMLAFEDALLMNADKLGGPVILIKYALSSHSFNLIPRILYPNVREKIADIEETLFDWEGMTAESWIYILSLLDARERPAFLQKENKEGFTLISRMIKWRPEALSNILSLLNEADQILVLRAKDSHDRTLLFTAVTSAEGLRVILRNYPEKERASLLKEKNGEGKTVLMIELYKNYRMQPTLLYTILSFYDAEERLDALRASLLDYQLHQLARYESNCLLPALNLLPPNDLLMALKQSDLNGMTIMGLLPYQESTWILRFLSLYPPAERLPVLRQPNSLGFNVFDTIDKTRENLQVLETLVGKHGVFTLLTESLSSHAGSEPTRTLRDYAGNIEKLPGLLNYFPSEERLQALRINVKGSEPYMKTWFFMATQNPNALLDILRLLPPENRSVLVLAENYSGETVLDTIARKDPQRAQSIQEIISISTQDHPTKRIKMALMQHKNEESDDFNLGNRSSLI